MSNYLLEHWRVIFRLYLLWKKHPELRLSQLIGNCYRQAIYYEEDLDFIRSLEGYYKSERD